MHNPRSIRFSRVDSCFLKVKALISKQEYSNIQIDRRIRLTSPKYMLILLHFSLMPPFKLPLILSIYVFIFTFPNIIRINHNKIFIYPNKLYKEFMSYMYICVFLFLFHIL